MTQTVSANGTLNPVVLVSVGTQVSGTVKKLYVDFNDKVEAGQPLLELDAALLTAQVKQTEASVANASAALELARPIGTHGWHFLRHIKGDSNVLEQGKIILLCGICRHK